LDGWWAEGYNGFNGWAIGEVREYYDQEAQAEADGLSLYEILEMEILPSYFNRGADGVPHHWTQTMKEAIRTCAPQFSMRRMIKDYTNRYYIPEIQQSIQAQQNHFEREQKLAAWKQVIRQYWNRLELYVDGRREGQLSLGEGIEIHAWVRSDGLKPEDLCVELVYGTTKDDGALTQHTLLMAYTKREQDGSYRYDVLLKPEETGSIAYNIRVIPCHPNLTEKYELGLIRWG
jgi:starch phosphorylase